MPVGAWAQEASAGATSVEAVIVTATKRSEQLKDVPQAITVLGQGRLADLNADSLEGFAGYVPGLEMQTFSPGRTRITIRGISPDEQTGVTTISYYLDEIPLTASDQRSQPTMRLYDIDQVEVLRGPQGTLYGEGAMGGTIRIITKKPDVTGFKGSIKLDGYGIQDGSPGYVADGMINVPLIHDILAGRVVVETRKDAGWIDQTFLSIPVPSAGFPGRYVAGRTEKDVNSSTDTSVRAALRFTPTEAFTADLTYVNTNLDVHSASIATVSATQHRDFALRPSTANAELWNLTAAYAFKGFTLTSASSYTTRDTFRFDPYEPIVFGSKTASTLDFSTFLNTEVFTQEVRAVSQAGNRLRWTVGAYYRDGTDRSGGTYNAFIPASNSSVVFYTYTDKTEFQSRALFGEVEYDLTDALTLIAGARWFEDEQQSGTRKRKSDGTTPKATLRYRFNKDAMIYATYSEGFRAGGFNFNAGPPQYEPDTTKNYEIGAKVTSPDGRLSVSGAAYFIDWSNMQFIQLSSGGFFTFVGNANKASSRGLEAELNYKFDGGLWTQLSGNLTSAHLDSNVYGNFTGIIPKGRDLPMVPHYKLSAIVGYDTQVFGNYDLSLTAAVSFIGKQNSKLEEKGTYTDGLFGGVYVIGSQIPASSNGRLRAELKRDNWGAALYVNNLWNDHTPIGNDNFLPTLGQPLYYLQPRTIGVEVSARF
ncbi:MAG: TonB-dependent receptor [Phenylobacterium sp.]|nr:TonB-dependent receptor [Phenylobacterium sp.]